MKNILSIRISPVIIDLSEILLAIGVIFNRAALTIVTLILLQVFNSLLQYKHYKPKLVFKLEKIFQVSAAASLALCIGSALLGLAIPPVFVFVYLSIIYLLPALMAFHLFIPVIRLTHLFYSSIKSLSK
ncbi:hypothetical protein DVR12_04390 [Chitinophaga silvatica]|uniref:Uncharacterized protein n=1 Tax=Chitinophaga silvatica TaxID=2282649 RepID=A0A3E1YD23_9BACT|nr:hypothetical protein [Chitinophaga silvatica]RFS24455.1 hypothetical protein DVR12_04390 [Chitinophaga silvatica]